MLLPTLIAVPIFALMIAIEAFFSARRGRDDYPDGKDAWNNIFLGFMSLVFGAILGFAAGFIYNELYVIAPFKFPADAWWSWAVLFFVDDLVYYVFHRCSHEIRILWNLHVVHHSSEQFNLSVAVRQSWFSGTLHWIFYAPIMLVGFAPWMFATMHGLNLVYQFWIHTKFIDRLGWLEYFLNTPSHHRVHHGINEQYLDKNYAGVLIIWDRMFGSFVPETEEPRYGILKQINGYNPLWINTHGWVEMLDAIRDAPGVYNKLRCIFGSPDMAITSRYKAQADQP